MRPPVIDYDAARGRTQVLTDSFRPEEFKVTDLLRLCEACLQLVALKIEQPGKLLRARQEMEIECFQLFV